MWSRMKKLFRNPVLTFHTTDCQSENRHFDRGSAERFKQRSYTLHFRMFELCRKRSEIGWHQNIVICQKADQISSGMSESGISGATNALVVLPHIQKVGKLIFERVD